MIIDPIDVLGEVLARYISDNFEESDISVNHEISAKIGWRPHLYEHERKRAWYFHFEEPEADSWYKRALKAKEECLDLRIAIAAPLEVLLTEDFIELCVKLDASIAVIRKLKSGFNIKALFEAPVDFIAEEKIVLRQSCARNILDLLFDRAMAAETNRDKGVLLEILCVALMSQVSGFDTRAKGVSNRSQQMDVLVHNRNTGGVLAGSPIVLLEAKNWPLIKVTPKEYRNFASKMESRHGRCSLGFIVTTGKFTRNVNFERVRDSKHQLLIVLIDGKRLPTLWRKGASINDQIEELCVEATIGE